VAYTGDRRVARGIQSAATEDLALKILSGQGYKVLTLKQVPSFLPRMESVPFVGKIPSELIIIFTRQLALLLESGMDIISALELLRNQTANGRLKTVIGEVVRDLRKGETLSFSMNKHPRAFSKIYIQSITVGEKTGNLEIVLRYLADYIEKEQKAVKNITSALQYPVIVAVVAFIVMCVLTFYILPSFSRLYDSLGADLPGLTRLVIGVSAWLSHWGPLLLGIILAVGIIIYVNTLSAEGKYQRDLVMLKIPVLGRIAHMNVLVLCSRSIAMLYKAGLPVPEILTLVMDSCSNMVLKQALARVHKSVLKGEGLSHPMSRDPLFLPLMVQMVEVGEATGNLDVTLQATSDSFETESENRTRSMTNLIQPAVTVAIGIVVALIALSVFSAMYSIYGQIG